MVDLGLFRQRAVAFGSVAAVVVCLQSGLASAQGVDIYPGVDIQSQVNLYPAGTTFVLKSGVHRMQSIRPRSGDRYIGETGTVLSGAKPLTSFIRSGPYWVATGQTQQAATLLAPYQCQAGYTRCNYAEQLFIDGQALSHVGSLGEVGPGSWFFDYDADRIYFADDPSGHTVETSVTTTAFQPTGDSVTVSGLVIERYATIGQQGALDAHGRTGWVITGNEIRWNHGQGVRVGAFAQVIGNNVHHNGQLGIAGVGANILVQDNEIAYNNWAHYEVTWEAAGTKFISTNNLVLRGNWAHHNEGPGLWTDQDNINVLMENNTSEYNTWMGILHEISYSATIRYNTIRFNGYGFSVWAWGGGIVVSSSRDVEVYGNLVEGNADGIMGIQQNRGSGAFGPYEVWNLWVHDNAIANTEGWEAGLVDDSGNSGVFSARNNRFDYNVYYLRPLWQNGAPFSWRYSYNTTGDWKSNGQDSHGVMVQY